MQKIVPSILSADGSLHLTCPKSWQELAQDEGLMRYVLRLVGCGMYSQEEVCTKLLLHITGIKVVKRIEDKWACTIPVKDENGKRHRQTIYLQAWQVESMIQQLDYVNSYETMDVRLESVQGFKAVDSMLHHVSFGDYLNMEKYYQVFLARQEERWVLKLAQLLYPGGVTEIDVAERTNCIMWFSYVKKAMQPFFPHFFKPAPVSSGKDINWLEQTNAQVRALTEGDITKEAEVYRQDCWRALTELDAKAREAEEFRRKYPNS